MQTIQKPLLFLRHGLLATLAALILTSCNSFGTLQQAAFHNRSGQSVFIVAVAYDGEYSYSTAVGALGTSGGKASWFAPLAFPKEVTVHFDDGRVRTVDTSSLRDEVRGLRSSNYELNIYYTADDNLVAKVYLDTKDGSPSLSVSDQNDPQYQKYRQLLVAAYQRDTESLTALLASGAPTSWDFAPGLSPLEWSCARGAHEVFRILSTAQNAHLTAVVPKCLRLAAQGGHDDILRELTIPQHLELVDDQQVRQIVKATVELNASATPQTIGILLDFFRLSPDVALSDYGHTLLITAVGSRKKEIVRYLLEIGASTDLKLKSGKSVIDFAHDPEIRELLLR